MAWGYGYGYYRQPTKAELTQKARASARALERKGRTLRPIHVEGMRIARTWWGQAWCDNIDRYADFSNRVGRGKKYVRADCVIDLQVRLGHIDAVVQGSRTNPYEVTVDIDPVTDATFQALLDRCSTRAKSLDALMDGDFPQELKDQLTAGADGIFPAPYEIRLSCSCPDWARMCKHVAAAILAVAPLLDENPLMLFELRGIDTAKLVARTVEQKLNLMLEHADDVSPRVIEATDDDLTALFGVL